ncbi:MAG: methenyltetrahydromethanopterin cyclohydrolase [Xanthobacteraceae bacterium]
MSSSQTFSVNGRAAELVDRVKGAAAELKVAVARGELGETLIDAGSRSRGSIAALPFVALQLTAVIGGIGDMSPMARETSSHDGGWRPEFRPLVSLPRLSHARTPPN